MARKTKHPGTSKGPATKKSSWKIGALVERLQAARAGCLKPEQGALSVESEPGKIFSDYVSNLRDLEFQRMQTLETRGSRVSQTNLAVITAALAIASLYAKQFESSAITPVSGLVLVFSIGSLVMSLVYASIAHAGTSKISLTDEKTLDAMTGDKFTCPPVQARFVAAKRDAETVKSLYVANEKRGAHLEAAVALQIVFVIYLVLAVSVEIVGRIAISVS